MLQKALVMMLLFGVTILGSLLFFANLETVSSDRPLPIREVVDAPEELKQWTVEWQGESNEISNIGVIMNEPDILQVRVDYRYSGDQGEEVFMCGGVDERSRQVKWTCRPVQLKVGESTAILEFKMSSHAQDSECSKYVFVSIYRGGEEAFYRNYYRYKKAWVKGASGMFGRLEQFFHSCSTN